MKANVLGILGMTLFVVLVTCVCVVGCAVDSSSQVEQYGKKRDAAIDSPPPVDAPAVGAPGWASCWTSSAPLTQCHLAEKFCCFDEVNSPNWGTCNTNATPFQNNCLRSWNACDGNEDCVAGSRCNEHLMEAPFYPPALIFAISCESSWASGDHQMCHGPGDSSCPSGTTCTLGESSTVGYFGMPPNMYVCW